MDSGETNDLERYLEELRLALASVEFGTTSQSQPSVPQMATRAADPLRERLDRFMAEPIRIIKIREEFADLESLSSLTLNLEPVKYDFLDNALLKSDGIYITRYDDEFIVKLGRFVIPMLVSGFSLQGMAALFILAYHLRKPGGNEYLLSGIEDLNRVTDTTYEALSGVIHNPSGRTYVMTHYEDLAHEAQAYAYIAASLLRLFSKPPNSYMMAFNHIVNGYGRFYGKPMTIRMPAPAKSSIETLSHWFSNFPKGKATLFRILYVSNATLEGQGIKKFLYDLHLSYTGMHMLDILARLCKELDCSPELILAMVKCGLTSKQVVVGCLERLLKYLKEDDPRRARRMWRYGRLFDDTFMADIQTRLNPKLVYILAASLQMEAPETNSGILNITQLADLSEEDKVLCRTAATKLLQMVKEYMAKGPQADLYRLSTIMKKVFLI